MRNGLLIALAVVVVAAAFYLGTQSQEPAGPAERFGRTIDDSAKEVEKSLKKLADDLEKTTQE